MQIRSHLRDAWMTQNGRNSKRRAKRFTRFEPGWSPSAWCVCLTCPWIRLSAFWYTVPRGPVTGCAVTTTDATKASGIFPDVGDPEEFHKQQGTASSVRVRCTVSPAILAPAAGNQDVPGLAGRCLFDHAADILSACVRKKSVSLWNLCFIANRYARKYHSGAEIVPGSKSFDST